MASSLRTSPSARPPALTPRRACPTPAWPCSAPHPTLKPNRAHPPFPTPASLPERLPDPRYEATSLPFRPLALAEMLSAEQPELEAFLTHIYRAIASAAPLKVIGGSGRGGPRVFVLFAPAPPRLRAHLRPLVTSRRSFRALASSRSKSLSAPRPHPRLCLLLQDKVNVLSYFETLCGDTNAANVLINRCLPSCLPGPPAAARSCKAHMLHRRCCPLPSRPNSLLAMPHASHPLPPFLPQLAHHPLHPHAPQRPRAHAAHPPGVRAG